MKKKSARRSSKKEGEPFNVEAIKKMVYAIQKSGETQVDKRHKINFKGQVLFY